MDSVLAFLHDTLARWAAAVRRPLHEPAPVPPLPEDFVAMIDDEVEDARRQADALATEPLLPSTDYRTNPRPAQAPIIPRCYY